MAFQSLNPVKDELLSSLMAELPRMHSIQTLSPGASFTTVILVQESLFALRELHLLNALLCPSITKTVSVDTISVTTVVH